MTVLIDYEFRGTGWNPVCFKVEAKPASRIHIKLTSLGDPWDRFVALIVNDVEIIRAITPFDRVLEQTVDIPEPLSGAFLRGCKVCGIVTTFVGGWRYFAETLNEVSPTESPQPIFTVETMNSGTRKLSKTVPRFHAIRGYLYATGHSREEGATGRRFTITVDGEKVFDRDLNWGWTPGCGYLKPYEFKVDRDVSTVTIEAPNIGDYWKVSLALTTTVEKPPVELWPIPLILGMTPIITVGAIVGYNEYIKE